MKQQLHAKLTRAYDADADSLGGMVAGAAFVFPSGRIRPLWRIRHSGTKDKPATMRREKPLPDQRLVVELGAT